MIFFCEECGEKYKIDDVQLDDPNHFVCRVCNDVLKISPPGITLISPVKDPLAFNKVQTKRIKRKPIRLLIVEDSKVIRRAFCKIFEQQEEMQVVGEVGNGKEALQKIDQVKPDLIILDMNLPIMNGDVAFKHIMIKNPCPVVITSNLSAGSFHQIIEFLRLGAVDFVSKPVNNNDISIQQKKIIERVRLAAKAKINHFRRVKPLKIIPLTEKTKRRVPGNLLVIINSGAGGHAELFKLIPQLPSHITGCIVTFQSLPQKLTQPLTDYMDQKSMVQVSLLHDHAPFLAGRCYIGTHDVGVKLYLENNECLFGLERKSSRPEHKIHPFDIFLNSVAKTFSGHVLVILLSGAEVGDLEGLRQIKHKKAKIIAQKLNTCMLPFSLERAIQANLVDVQVDSFEITRQIL